ncbi:AraC family transcriptional regulator with amidase-like domain [Kribbella rubisoli]|jgi:transcriptional regulator GlxA family with amidase domain|uniref:AraC family transcriptional regulator with amidase-like domain n=1 Tax=Kribbella rubisoli TaxID=3075929 RepID=A0A4Q7WTI2_9ACTN|nr:helix-turn-helix domain-containing protein [Kribbella rubisoli]RZU13328.1 AraC family transcriptional regulator with amidase-like domain [Kribbella rubisoli]
MLHKVAVVLMEDVALFEFGVLAEVFGLDRTADGVPPFDFKVCSTTPGVPMDTSTFSQVIAPYGLEELEDADLIGIPATTWRHEYDERVLEALRRAEARGAILLTVCSGVYVLGAAGLLDGRPCTTHWRYTESFQQQFPTAKVDPDVLFVDDGNIITSAGTAAGIDACLHLVRRELGSAVATRIARRMVVPPQRDGGQRQYVDVPVPESSGESLQPVLDWMIDNLTTDHTVPALARRAQMSERTFARRFVAETGTTPLKWVTTQRVLRARILLEQTRMGIEQIASESGFGTAALLRHHFRRVVGVPPQDYRRTFQTAS